MLLVEEVIAAVEETIRAWNECALSTSNGGVELEWRQKTGSIEYQVTHRKQQVVLTFDVEVAVAEYNYLAY